MGSVMIPLLELFAEVDTVFEEHDSFDQNRINASLGRIYRQWVKTRSILDPGFDPKRYRYEQKRRAEDKGSRTSSTDRASISEKSRKPGAKSEKPSVRRSVRAARSGGRASNGR